MILQALIVRFAGSDLYTNSIIYCMADKHHQWTVVDSQFGWISIRGVPR